MAERLDFVLRLIDKITAPAKRATKGLQGINLNLKAIAGSGAMGKLATSATRASKSVAALSQRGDRLISLSANLNLASNSARMLSQQMTGMLLAPIQEAADFERSMSRVKAVTSDFTEEQRKLARQLGRDTKFTADQAAGAMANLAIAGFSAKQQMAALGDVLALDAAAGMGDLSETAQIGSRVLKGFGLEASEMARVSDVLTATFTNSNTTLATLGETMKFVAPVARAAGVSLEETAKLAGILGDAGIDASMAGTSMRLVMLRLAGTTPQANKALKQLKITTVDAAGNLRGISDILVDVGKSMRGLGTAARLKKTTQLFGRLGVTAGTQLIDQLTNSGASAEKLTRALQSLEGVTKRTADTMEDNLGGDIIKVESAISSLLITIGDVFTPELRTMAKVIKDDVLPPMEMWIDDNNTLVKVLGGSTAGIAGITASLAALGTAASVVTLIMGGVAKGAGIVAAAWATTISFGAGLLTVVQLLGTSLMGLVTGAIPAIVAGFKGMVAGISGAISVSLVSAVAAGMALVLVPIVVWWDDVKTLIAKIPPDMTELGADMAQGLIDGWKNTFIGGILEDVGSLVFDIEKMLGIASPSKVMMGIGNNMAAGLQAGMSGGMNANAPAQFAGSAAASMAGGGGARTMIMRNTINVTVGAGDGAAEGGSDVGESIATAVRKMFDDANAALGAG